MVHRTGTKGEENVIISDKKKCIKRAVVLLLALFGLSVALPQCIYATVTGQETSVNLFGANDTRVGRYQLNYIGNTNHYTRWTPDGIPVGQRIYNDLGAGYANSSIATLNRTTNTSKIKYAYLVWQTRAPQGATSPIFLLVPDGRVGYIYPTYAINDLRVVGSNSGMTSLFCMAADVTGIVQSAGYGDYGVCNIPMWVYGQNGDYTGGESPGSWQLIVVEEDDSFPVRAVKLDMGSKFYLGVDFGSELMLGNGLKSKSAGIATGQVFFGASNSGANTPMTENVCTYNSSGGLIGQVVSNTTYSPGLYKNGSLINDRDYGNGCIRMDLSNIYGNMGNNANRINLTVQNSDWTTAFLLGMAVDVAYPDFIGTQTTTVKSSTSVTVTGSFSNTAATPNTGIYNGNLVITLDSALTARNASAVINGTTVVSPTSIAENQVIFSGASVASMMNGSTISYTVHCSTNNSGRTVFNNDARFYGYLCSDGVFTGYWIDNMWIAVSSAIPKYSITIEAGNGIEAVSGGGDYPYGSGVSIDADLMPGYHWSNWSGSYNTTQQAYDFKMPNKNIILKASAEANMYTIVFDSNDGGTMTAIPNMIVQYDDKIILPDGASFYEKYTTDGVNITEQVLAQIQNQDAESQTDKKAYASVFMGWSLEEGKESFVPQWNVGEVSVSSVINATGMTNQNDATITLYAIWDDCPWITATHLYYTLEEAQNGFITEEEILSHATAFDREDGNPILPGFHENGTSFSIPDYSPADFVQLQSAGSSTENLTVVDSSGSVYAKQIMVYVVDTTPVAVKVEGTTRFINEYYYNQPYEYGGLEENSIWKTDPEYAVALQTAFDNRKNDTSVRTYFFTHEEILAMKEFITENGIGNTRYDDALQRFYSQFMEQKLVQ